MHNRKIGIIGYGVIGQQIECFLKEIVGEQKIDFFYFDDILYEKGAYNCFRFSDFDSNEFRELEFYIGLGYTQLERKKNICEQLVKKKYNFPYLAHKTAYIHPSAIIGNGVIIYPMCNIGFNVRISDGVIINNSSIISHDSLIDTCSFISAGVILSGNVQMSQKCFIGSGTVVANSLKIGKNVKIGAGSVITKDIDDDLLVIGNPIRVVNQLNIK